VVAMTNGGGASGDAPGQLRAEDQCETVWSVLQEDLRAHGGPKSGDFGRAHVERRSLSTDPDPVRRSTGERREEGLFAAIVRPISTTRMGRALGGASVTSAADRTLRNCPAISFAETALRDSR
jgi:hypothetical protein